MKKNTNSRTSSKEHSGVILILVVGVLAIMSLLAVSFAVNMQLEQKAAVNYLNSVKAECVAEAGAQKALADIRKWAKEQPYSTLTGNIAANYPPLNTAEVEIEGVGTYLVQIQDESAKVNINALTNTDSAEIDKLYNDGKLSYNQIAAIIDYRDSDGAPTTQLYTSSGWESCQGGETNAKNSPFATIEEIKVIAGIDDDSYEDAEDYITVDRQIVRGGLMAKYYKPVTAAFSYPNDSYLGSVVELGEIRSLTMSDVPGSESDEEAGDAQFGGGYLMNKKAGNDWLLDEFGVVYEGFIHILPTEIGNKSFSLDDGDGGARLYIDGQTVSGSHNFTYAGWHPIKIEYYDLSEENGLDFTWDSGDHVPSERLGYSPPITVDGVNYDNAGAYKIISTGAIEAADGSILAKRKTSAVVRVFGAWTVTTRSEFSAAWDNNYDDFSDGEIRWVTWLDSCPTDTDETGTPMNWDKSWSPTTGIAEYTITNDSLKLGYWDNFDEDVAYSTVNMRVYGTGVISYDEINNTAGTTTTKVLNLVSDPATTKAAKLNEYYCTETTLSDGMFTRVWERDWGQKDMLHPGDDTAPQNVTKDADGNDVWGFSASKRNSSPAGKDPCPEPNDLAGVITLMRMSGNFPLYLYMSDTDDQDDDWLYPPGLYACYDKDFLELLVKDQYTDAFYVQQGFYQKEKVLGFMAKGANYQGCFNGTVYSGKVKQTGGLSDVIDFRLSATNWSQPNVPPIWPPPPSPTGYPRSLYRPAGSIGAYSKNSAQFDNIRIIPDIPGGGYFASTPFYAGPNNVSWGTISWTAPSVDDTSIKMYVRAGATLPVADTFSTQVNSGGQLSAFTGSRIQFKTELSSSAFNTGDYEASSVTPVLKDVTITYLPRVEVLYRRNEIN